MQPVIRSSTDLDPKVSKPSCTSGQLSLARARPPLGPLVLSIPSPRRYVELNTHFKEPWQNMAEALAVLGALSSVLQIVDFSAKLTTHAHHLATSRTGALRENLELEEVVRHYETLTQTILEARAHVPAPKAGQKDLTPDQKVVQLAVDCELEAKSLLDELDALRIPPTLHGWRRFTKALRVAAGFSRSKAKIEEQCKKLERY